MRHAPAGGVLLLVLLASPVLGQSGKDLRVVKSPRAEVHSGPSLKDSFYVTNRLQKGDVVEVVDTMPDGWLKIRPPAGSTSWINKNFLLPIVPNKPNEVVALEDGTAPVFAAPVADSPQRERPKVISVKLKRGHQVTTRRVVRDDDGSWVEIDSPQSEPRYIRADDVEQAGGASDLVRAGTAPTAGALPRSTAPSANLTNAAEEMRRQAVQADLSGNTAEAIRLYDRICAQFAASYPRLVQVSRARAAYLRGEYPVPPGIHPDAQAREPSTGPVRAGPRQDGTSSTFSEREDRPGTTRAVSGGHTSRLPAGWKSYRGRLVAAPQPIDGVRAYRLEATYHGTWMPVAYVVAGPGVNLEPYVNRGVVEVRGPEQGSRDVLANVLRAMQVFPVE